MATSIKISQLPAKGSNLEATDLLEISEFNGTGYVTKSITGAEIIASVPPTSVEWGDIGGTLSAQTDLNTALSGKVPTTRTLTINGTTQDLSADRTFTVSTGITIGTTAITSGTVGRVLFEGTGNVVQESANLFWDNTNGRLGIGGTPSTYNLDVVGTARISDNVLLTNGIIATSAATTRLQSSLNYFAHNRISSSGLFGFLINYVGSTYSFWRVNDGSADIEFGGFGILKMYTNNAERLRIHNSTGNLLINTTTDAGFKFDVNGTARVSNTLTVSHPTFTGSITISATANQTHRITGPGGGTITFGPDNAIRIGIGETYFSGDVLANSFWMQSNGSTVFGAQSTPPASTLVEMRSTTKGFLPPRMTTTQKNAIASPVAGLVVYDTTLNKLCVRTASAWETITSL